MFSPGLTVTELSESAQRGRRFAPVRERDLEPSLRSIALRLPGAAEGLVLAPEFRGARGVVDLLAVTRVADKFIERTELGAPYITSEADSAVLARLSPRLTRTAANVARAVGMTDRQALTRLRALCRAGAAEQVGNGYRRRHGFDPIGRSYALEAKVDDWRKGLSQAMRYASWADAAGVVLLVEPPNLTAVRARFRALRIGLAIGDSWIVRPVIGRPDPGRRLALSEQLSSDIGASLGRSDSA